MGMNLAHGATLTHGSPVNMSGKYFNIVPYGIDESTGMIDLWQATWTKQKSANQRW